MTRVPTPLRGRRRRAAVDGSHAREDAVYASMRTIERLRRARRWVEGAAVRV